MESTVQFCGNPRQGLVLLVATGTAAAAGSYLASKESPFLLQGKRGVKHGQQQACLSPLEQTLAAFYGGRHLPSAWKPR